MPVRQYESICISMQYNILRCDDSAIVNNFSINVIGSLASGAQPRQIACPFPAGSSNPREYDVETYLKSAGIISGNRASFLKHKSVWSFDSGRNSRAGVISAHPHEHSPLEHCPHISRLMSVISPEKTQGNLSGTAENFAGRDRMETSRLCPLARPVHILCLSSKQFACLPLVFVVPPLCRFCVIFIRLFCMPSESGLTNSCILLFLLFCPESVPEERVCAVFELG